MIDKSNSKFKEYTKKLDEIMAEWENETEKNTEFRGLDGPQVLLDKQMTKKIIELQKEYSFLFEDK
jgi:hypothetical protein